MMANYSNEKWVGLYEAALVEVNPSVLEDRIKAARAEIDRRTALLEASVAESAVERIAMSDALTQLRSLENIQKRRQA
jgi:hypothetical protein